MHNATNIQTVRMHGESPDIASPDDHDKKEHGDSMASPVSADTKATTAALTKTMRDGDLGTTGRGTIRSKSQTLRKQKTERAGKASKDQTDFIQGTLNEGI